VPQQFLSADPTAGLTLGPEDFTQLKALGMSADPTEQDQFKTILGKLTPDEQRQWSAWAERNRDDNSLFGVPPELALWGGMGVARGVARGALSAGAGIASRTLGAMQGLIAQGSPWVKYEATRTDGRCSAGATRSSSTRPERSAFLSSSRRAASSPRPRGVGV